MTGFGLIGLGPGEVAAPARVAFGGAVLYGAFSVWRGMRAFRERNESADPRAPENLWERYGRGESSWEEYEAMSRDLEQRSPPPSVIALPPSRRFRSISKQPPKAQIRHEGRRHVNHRPEPRPAPVALFRSPQQEYGA